MIFNIKEFEKKLIDKELNRKELANRIGIAPNTLSMKIDGNSDFKIKETIAIARELGLNDTEFMMLFFNKKLSLNESHEEESAAREAM
ncbi:MAG TPA: hypothetical protein VEG39_10890 [Clostridia bacterium]|nr:hypothetical protein [Clostridia bacterium]